MKKIFKTVTTLLAVLLLSGALANSFSVRLGATDIQLPSATTNMPAAALVASVEYQVDLGESAGALFGVTAGTDALAGTFGVTFDLPTNDAADADLFLAARAGVTTTWAFDTWSPLATATLGVRGDNGLILEGGVLVRFSDFGFSSYSLAPVVALGFQF